MKWELCFHFMRSCSRVQTQSQPPVDDGSEGHGGGEVGGELVVAGGDTPPIFETAKHSFDQVAQFVVLPIERMMAFAGWVIGNDRSGAARDQKLPELIAVIGGVSRAQTTGRQRFKQAAGNRGVAALAWGYGKGQRPTATVDNSMDFCRSPAARAADRPCSCQGQALELGPPFPPAAERCALAVVLSIIWMPSGSALTSAVNSCRQIPRRAQR